MNILITGGAGFIGSNLAAYHIAQGDSVFVVDDFSSGSIKNIVLLQNSRNFQFAKADILVWDKLNEVTAWSDRIYHMAAIVGVKNVLADPRAVLATNITGTERLFRIISEENQQVQILLASTSEVYGFNPKSSFIESDDIIFKESKSLRWCYAITKLADEYIALAYAINPGLKVAIARLFNTIGPNQTQKHGWVVPSFINQAMRNESITIYGDGSQTRSFCDVRDMIQALDLLVSTPASYGEVVNVGNNHEISILDLAYLVKDRVGSQSEMKFISYKDAYGIQFDDIFHRRPILSKLKQLTGFTPQWTLTETLDFLIQMERKRS